MRVSGFRVFWISIGFKGTKERRHKVLKLASYLGPKGFEKFASLRGVGRRPPGRLPLIDPSLSKP